MANLVRFVLIADARHEHFADVLSRLRIWGVVQLKEKSINR